MYLHVPVHVDGPVSGAGPPHTHVSGVERYAFSLCVCDLEHLTLWMEVVFSAGALAHLHCLWLCWRPGMHRPSESVLPSTSSQGSTWKTYGAPELAELPCRLTSCTSILGNSAEKQFGKCKNDIFVAQTLNDFSLCFGGFGSYPQQIGEMLCATQGSLRVIRRQGQGKVTSR